MPRRTVRLADSPTDLSFRGLFDYIIAFPSSRVIPDTVKGPTVKAICNLIRDEDRDLERAVTRAFAAETTALDHTPVVFGRRASQGFADGFPPVQWRQMTYGPLSSRPWGLALPSCPSCKSAAHFRSFAPRAKKGQGTADDERAQYSCEACDLSGHSQRPKEVTPLTKRINWVNFHYVMPYPPPTVKEFKVAAARDG